ncbi:Ig domain-containing protein [Candidatus Margulisiibacteriota bacterium]
MKKFKKLLILLCIFFVITGCKTLTDIITAFEDDVTQVNISTFEANMYVDEVINITAAVEPVGANPNIIWETSNKDIVSVQGGQIEAHRTGQAIIKALSQKREKYAECVINVIEPGMAVISGAIDSVNTSRIKYDTKETSVDLTGKILVYIYYQDQFGYKRAAACNLNNNNYFSFTIPQNSLFTITFNDVVSNELITSFVMEGQNHFQLINNTHLKNIKIENDYVGINQDENINLTLDSYKDIQTLQNEVTYDETPGNFVLKDYLALSDANYIVKKNTFFGKSSNLNKEWDNTHFLIEKYYINNDESMKVERYRIDPNNNIIEFFQSELLFLENGFFKTRINGGQVEYNWTNHLDKGTDYSYQKYNYVNNNLVSNGTCKIMASFSSKEFSGLGNIGPGIILKTYSNGSITFYWAVKGLGIINKQNYIVDEDNANLVPENNKNTNIIYCLKTDQSELGSQPSWFQNVVDNLPESDSDFPNYLIGSWISQEYYINSEKKLMRYIFNSDFSAQIEFFTWKKVGTITKTIIKDGQKEVVETDIYDWIVEIDYYTWKTIYGNTLQLKNSSDEVISYEIKSINTTKIQLNEMFLVRE